MADKAAIYIVRPGHSMQHGIPDFPRADPTLTSRGMEENAQVPAGVNKVPTLLLVSPLTRSIETAFSMFPLARGFNQSKIEVQVWSDLREADDQICNQTSRLSQLMTEYPNLNFKNCREHWEYEQHTHNGAVARAERVRARVKELSADYNTIWIITHQIFIGYLVEGTPFRSRDTRKYEFAAEEDQAPGVVFNRETGQEQDYGPTMLVEKIEHI
ncbi:uncharacterized protein JN550_004366 [Neoarthrinium moseri]|uniref:uncharacterized protein n=1 Tax=Neoarthrinium moseri TaxID=1658444 RepID=UPI001FDC7464|nr:uncharacterized protein JN550_004366 [Neoarthrinium moseri]KAI1871372.1 hypothetical protein JN550_004366 [Neoarthrinium moseri]